MRKKRPAPNDLLCQPKSVDSAKASDTPQTSEITLQGNLPHSQNGLAQFGQGIARIFRRESFIAGESVAALLISFGVLCVAVGSLVQSFHANRASQASVQLTRESLNFAREVEAGRKALTLKATISDDVFPPTLSISPTSEDVVLSDSELLYDGLTADDTPVHVSSEPPGSHTLGGVCDILSTTFHHHKRRLPPGFKRSEITFFDIGYFPVLLKVEYVFEGHAATACLLYDVYYDNLEASPFARGYPQDEIPVRKPRFVRRLENSENPEQVLASRYHEWYDENFDDQDSN